VSFNPKERNRSYGQDVEFYAYFKAMRSFRLVGEKTTVPPWHAKVPVFGHTFGDGPERLAYKLAVEGGNRAVSFAACSVHGVDYQTLRIVSMGETGASYAFEIPQEARQTFAVVPAKAFVPAGQFRIIVARFSPAAAGKFKVTARCSVNGKPEQTLNVVLSGQCFAPRVAIESNGRRVNFRPTCLGTTSSRPLALRNVTGLNLVYRFLSE
jgi:hypothetical protein